MKFTPYAIPVKTFTIASITLHHFSNQSLKTGQQLAPLRGSGHMIDLLFTERSLEDLFTESQHAIPLCVVDTVWTQIPSTHH